MKLSIRPLQQHVQSVERRKKGHFGKWLHMEPFGVVSLPVARELQKQRHAARSSLFDEHRMYVMVRIDQRIHVIKVFIDTGMDGKWHQISSSDASHAGGNGGDNHNGGDDIRDTLFCNRQLLASLEEYWHDLHASSAGQKSNVVAEVLKVVTESQLVVWKRIVVTPVSSADHAKLHPTFVNACLRGTVIERDSIIKLPSLSVARRGDGGLPDRHEFVSFRVSSVEAPVGASKGMRFGLSVPDQTMVHVEQYHESASHRFLGLRDMMMDMVLRQEQTEPIMQFVRSALGVHYVDNNKSWKQSNLHKSLILHGPRGVGKTTMIDCIAERLGAQLFRITAADIYSEQYSHDDGEDDSSSSGLSAILKRASMQHSAILLIDDIDVLFPRDDESKDIYLMSEFNRLLALFQDDGNSHGGRPFAHVALIGVTSRINSLDPFVRKRFQEEVFIDVPSMEERRSMIRHFSQLIPACSSISEEYLDKLSDGCHGYVQADIHSMFRFAAHSAICRQKRNDDAKPTIVPSDFDDHKSLYGYRPYAIRESTIAVAVPQIPRVAWSDIGGLKAVKDQLHEMIVWPLKHSDAFERMGIKPPSGVLLYGPPGTGKTLLAKAVSSASNANFISINIPDLIKAEIGESEKTLSEMFRRAKLAAPSVIFFDEIQAMFGARENVSRDQQKLISQLLLEMDALADDEEDSGLLLAAVDTSMQVRCNRNIVVIAATNIPQNIDTSLMRPGRFERILHVAPPDAEARQSILEMTLRNMRIDDEMRSHDKLQELVRKTENYTGADLVNLCHQAGLAALCRDISIDKIHSSDFDQALRLVRPA